MNQPPYPPQDQPPYGQPPHGQPPQGGYPPPYGAPGGPPPGWPPAARGPSKGPIIAVIVLAVAVVGVLVTLWLTGVFNRTATTPTPAPAPVAGPAAPAPTPTPTPAPVQTGELTRDYLIGIWGPGCPGSTASSLEFLADGTVTSAQGTGSWTVSGNTVTTTDANGATESSYWTPQGPNAAAVNVPGVANAVLNRCQTM